MIIRRIILQLKAAGMIDTSRGKEGMKLAKPLGLFHFHENPNPACPVGKNIHNAFDGSLSKIQGVLEEKMRSINLTEIAGKIIA